MTDCRSNERVPLTAKLEELAGPLPRDIIVATRRRRRREHRIQWTPIQILKAIITDALASVVDAETTVLESVPALEPGDATMLVLRCAGRNKLMVAVAPSIIRSERLRRGSLPRDLDAEREFEVARLTDSLKGYDDEEEYED
jgi:hypothetical protein